MKYVLIIGDGMADDAVEELYGKTPLQYAKTPNMDALARAGALGSVLTIPEGMPPGSDTAILSIFGCDPNECYTGRAPLEAAASGISLELGDVAYRCNMVTFEETKNPFEQKKLLSHSAGSIEGDLSIELINYLFDNPTFREAAKIARMEIHPAPSFRHIAVQKATDISGIELIPPHDHLGEVTGLLLPKGGKNAAVLENLMRIAHEVLEAHPENKERRKAGMLQANGIWFWAEGTAAKLPNFRQKYEKSGGVISAVPLCHGIGALIGLEKIIVEGATGELITNYEGKVDAAIGVLQDCDFVAIHIEAPDECTHNGDLLEKVKAIEWIDERIVAPVISKLKSASEDFRMLVISDHRTLYATRGHDSGPVPYVIYDSRFNNMTNLSFCEADAKKGRFIALGTELMDELFASDKGA